MKMCAAINAFHSVQVCYKCKLKRKELYVVIHTILRHIFDV